MQLFAEGLSTTMSAADISPDIYTSLKTGIECAEKDKQISIYRYLRVKNVPIIEKDNRLHVDIYKLPSTSFDDIWAIISGKTSDDIRRAKKGKGKEIERGKDRSISIEEKPQIMLESSADASLVLPFSSITSSSTSVPVPASTSTSFERRVTIMDSKPEEDEESDDATEQRMKKGPPLNPTQIRIQKKLRDCAKRISKHRRVYVEKSYEQDIHDHDEDVDVLVEDGGDADDENENEPEPETAEGVDEDEDDEKEGGTGLGGDGGQDETVDDEDMKTDNDDTDNDSHTDYSHSDADPDLEISDDEGSEMETDMESTMDNVNVRLNFSKYHLTDRFSFYMDLMTKDIPFGDCSNLGIEL